MKKGFTLIELLIVMIIVGVLVAIALPKYNAAVERSRSVEGVLNLEKMSADVNALYILNDNTYPTVNDALKTELKKEAVKNVNFSFTSDCDISGTASQVTICIKRNTASGYNYQLKATNENGEMTQVECLPADGDDCKNIVSINLSK